jgi:hypothetical protein
MSKKFRTVLDAALTRMALQGCIMGQNILFRHVLTGPSAAAGSPGRGAGPAADYPLTWNPEFFMSETVAFCTVPRAAVNDVWFCSAEANASE